MMHLPATSGRRRPTGFKFHQVVDNIDSDLERLRATAEDAPFLRARPSKKAKKEPQVAIALAFDEALNEDSSVEAIAVLLRSTADVHQARPPRHALILRRPPPNRAQAHSHRGGSAAMLG